MNRYLALRKLRKHTPKTLWHPLANGRGEIHAPRVAYDPRSARHGAEVCSAYSTHSAARQQSRLPDATLRCSS